MSTRGTTRGAALRRELAVLILAAGQGTRMKSDKAKVLHELAGRPMITHVVDRARALRPSRMVVVVGHQAGLVRAALRRDFPELPVSFAIQRPRLGTGHAVLTTRRALSGFAGDVLILSGDVPLFRTQTMRTFVRDHRKERAELSVLSFLAKDPSGYGRIVKGPRGELLRNVEHRDANAEELRIREVNSGIYLADKRLLFRLLPKVGRANSQKEYYLTDVIGLAVKAGRTCRVVRLADAEEARGVNTLEDLAAAEAALRRRRPRARRPGGRRS